MYNILNIWSEWDEHSVSVTTGYFLNCEHEVYNHASYSISSPTKVYD